MIIHRYKDTPPPINNLKYKKLKSHSLFLISHSHLTIPSFSLNLQHQYFGPIRFYLKEEIIVISKIEFGNNSHID